MNLSVLVPDCFPGTNIKDEYGSPLFDDDNLTFILDVFVPDHKTLLESVPVSFAGNDDQ
jgi:hypothetical protein